MDYTGKAVIYKIINLQNAKFYVGSTIKWYERLRKHRRELRGNKHHCPHLQAAWNKCGEDSFVFKVVQVVDDPQLLHSIEQALLDEHHGTESCYNFARYTDNSSRGVVRSDSHKAAIAESLKQFYANNPNFNVGRKHTEDAKRRIREKHLGKTVSDTTKEKLRAANLGKKASEATRALLSAQRKGKVRTSEHAAKYNKAVIEVISGEVFPSLKSAKERFDMSPGAMAKALASDRPISKGKNAGKHFKYVDTP